ncbi:MAG: 5'-nucleotidase C-terminal domain-containing protein [Saprospiraceae bacterium]|nr:5'-nucleotidase C-terminal domain-containing protein [Saprospiraceae bacterium]
MADAIKEGAKSDIGMINPGSIRADLDIGEITVEEIVNIYPFIDKTVTVEIDGKALFELLEYSASLTYGLVQFSGLEIEYDFRKAVGQRLVAATVNGKDIKETNKYTVSCSSFVAGGGDGFSMLKNGKVIARSETKQIDYLLDYIKQRKNIYLPEIGRQTIHK